jgi:DNA (cytosine-5)-methyltransferase 1
MFGDLKPWKTAREIIDWSNRGESIFRRKTPLRPNTMRRIMAGLYKFGLRPFVIGHPNTTHDNLQSVDSPLRTITSQSSDMALAQPFIIQMDQGGYIHDIDKPLPTITSADAWALVEPYIVPLNHGPDARAYDIDKPLPTITSVDAWGLIQPYLVEYHGDGSGKPRIRSIDEPLPTIDTGNRFGLAEPYLVEYHGTGKAHSIDEPLKTLTGTDVFGIAWPLVLKHADKLYLVDIYYRMLMPRELARGQSIPDWYQFVGNREQVVKQIGNAVPRRLAKALIKKLLEE